MCELTLTVKRKCILWRDGGHSARGGHGHNVWVAIVVIPVLQLVTEEDNAIFREGNTVGVDVIPVRRTEHRHDILGSIPTTQPVAILFPGEPAFDPHADLILLEESEDHLKEVRSAFVPQIDRVEVLVKVLPVTGISHAFNIIGLKTPNLCCNFLDLLRRPIAWCIARGQLMFQSRLACMKRKGALRPGR